MTERMKELGFNEADVKSLDMNPFVKIGDEWSLIAAGNEEDMNAMTASWGGLGVMWRKNVAVMVVRPQRYTKKFIDASDRFTVSFYPSDKRKALQYCGSHSGSDMAKGEKIRNSGLTPLYVDSTAAFEEANLILICKKLYESKIDPDGFADRSIIGSEYPSGDFHTAYIAEITAAYTK